MSEFNKYQDDSVYQIRIMGNLDTEWSSWFHGMKVSSKDGDHLTTLTGYIPDQAKLRGILNKIWDLNLMVISFYRLQEYHSLTSEKANKDLLWANTHQKNNHSQ